MLRAVIDTNVFISSLRSSRGASFAIFQALERGEWQIVMSNHLLSEYEEIAKNMAPELGLSFSMIDDVLDAIAMTAEARALGSRWIPRLVDPDDEPILQLAAEAEVPQIVTCNVRHLKPAESFGIQLLTPGEFLVILRQTA